jgi:hypothetical protein
MEEARQKILANQFICGANNHYEVYRRELEHRDEYPNTISVALEIMERRGDNTTVQVPDGSGVAFAITSANNSTANKNGGNTSDEQTRVDAAAGHHAHIQCFACG